MSKRIVYLLLAVSIGLNAGMVASTLMHRKGPGGQPPGPGGGGPGPGPGQRPDPERLVEDHLQGMVRHLDLDAEQQQTIRTVMERQAPLLMEFQQQVQETGRRLAEAFGAPEFDPELFRRLTAEASDARSRLDSLSAATLVAEAAVLTPEQRRKFAEVAPTIHSQPQPPHREGRPPPR